MGLCEVSLQVNRFTEVFDRSGQVFSFIQYQAQVVMNSGEAAVELVGELKMLDGSGCVLDGMEGDAKVVVGDTTPWSQPHCCGAPTHSLLGLRHAAERG